MFNAKCLLILTLLLTSVYFYGCSETTNPVVEEPTIEPIANPVVEEPTIEPIANPVVEEPVVVNNFCSVGDVLQPGESCLDGTGDAFTVLEDGFGQYLFLKAGKSINFFGPGNTFSAEKQDDGTWKILSVTPKE